MPILRPLFGILFIFAAGTALAQEPLDMRTGLWEVDTDRSSQGMPQMPAMPQLPPDVLAKLPPAQRAQIEKAMRGSSAMQPAKSTSKVCLTEAQLRKSPDMGLAREADCRITRSSRTARAWELEGTCASGGGQQVMKVRYDVVTPERIEGTIDIAMTGGGMGNMSMSQKTSGRWVSADCGAVKPVD